MLAERTDPERSSADVVIPPWVLEQAEGLVFLWTYKVCRVSSLSVSHPSRGFRVPPHRGSANAGRLLMFQPQASHLVAAPAVSGSSPNDAARTPRTPPQVGMFFSFSAGTGLVLRKKKGVAGGPGQGLTLVHLSAQLERFAWDRGCTQGLYSPCQGGVRGCSGCVGCFLASDTAQVELKSGRV